MNLHGLVSTQIGVVNPPLVGAWLASTGYATDAAGHRTPIYDRTDGISMQVQALDGEELKQVDSLNVEGVKRAVYMFGDVQGANRPAAKGGDLLVFNSATWLVVMVLETWEVGWCKVAVSRQMDA